MQIIKEEDQPDKGGVKYMIRGPNIDWGVITLQPGDVMGPHYHEEIAETFYMTEGTTTFILKDGDIDFEKGSALRLEEHESHGLKNITNKPSTLIFIKEGYKPKDKVIL